MLKGPLGVCIWHIKLCVCVLSTSSSWQNSELLWPLQSAVKVRENTAVCRSGRVHVLVPSDEAERSVVSLIWGQSVAFSQSLFQTSLTVTGDIYYYFEYLKYIFLIILTNCHLSNIFHCRTFTCIRLHLQCGISTSPSLPTWNMLCNQLHIEQQTAAEVEYISNWRPLEEEIFLKIIILIQTCE